MRIAEAVKATLCHRQHLAGGRHVADGRPGLFVDHRGPDGNPHIQGLAARSGLVPASPGATVFPPAPWHETKIDEGVQGGVADESDIGAIAAVAAIGPALRQVRTATKTQATVAALAGFDIDHRLIDEFHGSARRCPMPVDGWARVLARH